MGLFQPLLETHLVQHLVARRAPLPGLLLRSLRTRDLGVSQVLGPKAHFLVLGVYLHQRLARLAVACDAGRLFEREHDHSARVKALRLTCPEFEAATRP